jgi:hypothetical protein
VDHIIDLHAEHRFDDDGGPPRPETFAMPTHIGIAMPPPADTEAAVADGDGSAKPIVEAPEAEPALTWQAYCAWRRTKCRPYDHKNSPALVTTATTAAELMIGGPDRERALEEIDQATHEVVGEAAELAELFFTEKLDAFYGTRDKLIDECGDILFCACWAMDAWGKNPLDDAEIPGLELITVGEDETVHFFRTTLMTTQPDEIENGSFLEALALIVQTSLSGLMCGLGLTANAFKKLKFQRRPQDVDSQIKRIAGAMCVVNQLLYLVGSDIKAALRSNMKKLDARYPNGYRPGQGGGIGTGDGK